MLRFFLSESAKKAGIVFEAPRSGDAGFDLRSLEEATISGRSQILVATGLHLAIPEGFVGIIKDRSSMASKRIYTHGGVIDASYRGEVKILLSNAAEEPYTVGVGAKIAQLLIVPCETRCLAEFSLDALGSTDRGSGGFGSTGVR